METWLYSSTRTTMHVSNIELIDFFKPKDYDWNLIIMCSRLTPKLVIKVFVALEHMCWSGSLND